VLMLLSIFCRKCTNTPTSSIPSGQPNHTPPSPYRCRHCGSTDLSYRTVQPGNWNGNDGRHYYVCVDPSCREVKRQNAGQHDGGWVTWDDDIGVTPGNPPCYCLPISRQDTAGQRSPLAGRRFWTCSTGACHYTSWRLDGTTGWGDGF
jgi:hypothetical protein